MTAGERVRLSEAQLRVVGHGLDAPAIVDAGAGTGKTFTIVERVAELQTSGCCPADAVLLLTFGRKAAAELRDRIVKRLGEAGPECSTFHAFAWSIVSAHLYDIGLSPDTTVIEDAEARVIFRTAFDEYLLDPQAGDSGFPLRQFNRDELRVQLFRLRQQLKERSIAIDAFRDRALAAADAFARISYRALRQPYPKKAGYKELATITDEELAAQTVGEKRRVNAAYEIFARFDRALAQRHALTYADILVQAEEALQGTAAVRDELRARYRCCIVDEYQDTDLAQHRFLEALFGAGLERIMVVGDVLQSIYSFRGAQPHNVEAFKQAPGAVTYPLHENRRSRQEILDLAHHLIAPAHPDAQALTGERGAAGQQIVHVSSLWGQADAAQTADADPGDRDDRAQPAEFIPVDEARRREAEAVAARIRHLLDQETVVEAPDGTRERLAPRHIAILTRTKRNVQPVTEALLAAGVPFRLVGGVGFYDAPEVRDVLAWLRLLADPFDGQAIARALRSPAIAASDAAAAALARGIDRDETAFARRVLVLPIEGDDDAARAAREAAGRLRGLLDALAPHAALPLIGAVRAVLEQTGVQRHYETSLEMRAPQASANLQKLEALARGFAQDNPGAQPADFVAFIDELERIDFDEREADVPSYDAVTISTIHSAKGLEWPIVFVLSVWPQLPAAARLRLAADGALLYGEDADGSRPFHYRADDEGADADGVVPRETHREDDEEARLLYVAVTRARDRLFMSGPRRKPAKGEPLGALHKFLARAYAWVRARGWVSDEPVPPRASRRRDIQPTSRSAASPRHESKIEPTRPASLPFALSYSLVAAYDTCPRRATYRAVMRLPGVADITRRRRARRGWEEVDSSPIDDPLLDEGEYGELLHKMLELWALARRDGNAAPPSSALLAEAAARLGQSPPREQAASARRAIELVANELRDWTTIAAEAPFTLDFGSAGKPLLVSGYLDLLARDGQGRACVVDFKTGGVRGERLGLQLALYRAAAQAAYRLDEPLCFAGRIERDGFTLEPVELISDDELHAHIIAAHDGLVARDVRPKPGAWCYPCAYRAAPCMDYQQTPG